MSKIAIKGATTGTGVFTLESPATNTDRTLILPDEAGTVLTSASPVVPQKGVPAFSAYNNANQAVTTNTFTKVQLNTENFDTNNCFDNTTNYRFTPTVAGYYLVTAAIPARSSITRLLVSIYKNGSEVYRGTDINVSSQQLVLSSSTVMHMNGSTDYIELYVYFFGSSELYYSSQAECPQMSAVMVRSA